MGNIIFFVVLGIAMYIVIQLSNGKPIIPNFNKDEAHKEQPVK